MSQKNGHGPDFDVSMVRAALETETTTGHFRALMAAIGSDKWRGSVEAVRSAYAAGGKDAAAGPKKKLPGILFSGTFARRAASALIAHSGLICVDLDDLGDRVESTRDLVVADPHTLACFVSPTGTGLKVIFRCDPARPHVDSFRAAERHVLENFGLEIDQACKDVSRLCFVSHDPDAFVAEDAKPLPYLPAPAEFKSPLAQPTSGLGALTPGDDYDQRGDLATLLTNHGWTKCGRNGWTRPGRTSGVSATWDAVPRRFYVFSSSTEFQPNHVYRPWHVFAILECGGDFSAAARELGRHGFGSPARKPAPAEPPRFETDFGDAPGANGTHPPLTGVPITNYGYPDGDDPSILLGRDDYLGRGGGLLFVSHAGAGKSSWILDACMSWALGRPWMGIRSNGPLKSLVIQAEDSDRYVGKLQASFAFANNLTPEQSLQMGQNCLIVRLKGVSGPAFYAELKRLTELHKPDLVVINPLYLYADGDIGRSEFTQPFLLNLDHINKAEKFAYILVHHTGKPQAKGKDGTRATVEDWESAYMGFGSSYLANWPRCTALLEPVVGESGRFTIKLGKGGLNAGVTKQVPHGAGYRDEPVTRIPIKHSSAKMPVNGIDRPVYYWEKDVETEQKEIDEKKEKGRPEKYNFSEFKTAFPAKSEPALPLNQILRIINGDGCPIKPNQFYNIVRRYVEEGFVQEVVELGKHKTYRQAI